MYKTDLNDLEFAGRNSAGEYNRQSLRTGSNADSFLPTTPCAVRRKVGIALLELDGIIREQLKGSHADRSLNDKMNKGCNPQLASHKIDLLAVIKGQKAR